MDERQKQGWFLSNLVQLQSKNNSDCDQSVLKKIDTFLLIEERTIQIKAHGW